LSVFKPLFWRCAFGALGCGSAEGVADAAGFLSRWFSAPRGWLVSPFHEQLGRAEILERIGIAVELVDDPGSLWRRRERRSPRRGAKPPSGGPSASACGPARRSRDPAVAARTICRSRSRENPSSAAMSA